MQGSNEHAGMIPRTVEQIYHVAQKLQPMGWDYTMSGQFLEIYNESIHDLLGNAADYGKVKHDIHHDKNGKTTVTDIATGKLHIYILKCHFTHSYYSASQYTKSSANHVETSQSQ
jgi:kinesin family protein C1